MVVCSFVLFLLAIVLSVLLRSTDSDYPFGIYKLFLYIFNDCALYTTWKSGMFSSAVKMKLYVFSHDL